MSKPELPELDTKTIIEMLQKKSGIRFNPTLSFDGVAIVLACIYMAVSWGDLRTTVAQHTRQIANHDAMLQELARSQGVQDRTLATLTTILNERKNNERPN